MRVLRTILNNIKIISIKGDDQISIAGISANSKQIKNNDVFVAVTGTQLDGHQFISSAIEHGATVIVHQNNIALFADKVTYIQVENAAIALGEIAHQFYEQPSMKIKLIGITGTNGKTSVATISHTCMQSFGIKCGLISTIENKIGDTIIPSTHTTPDPIQLNQLLAQMVAENCTYAFMEVSSHAVHQHRIAGIQFAGGVFTNITHDHLDYHHTFENYIAAKKSFFDHLPSHAFALVNVDDKRGMVMLQNCKAKKFTYSIQGHADFTCRIKENNLTGLVLTFGNEEVSTQLCGAFNAWNLLAVYAVMQILEFNQQEILVQISKVKAVEGRFDIVFYQAKNITAIVDYAHTPDAVEKILSTVKESIRKNQKIIVVIGCGGDRDKTKRPLMAKVAAQFGDTAIFTSDNPRSEKPEQILAEMQTGITHELIKKCISIADRKEAIKTAVLLADFSDVIVVAGKGHEKYQEIMGVKYPFDDKQILIETFKLMK